MASDPVILRNVEIMAQARRSLEGKWLFAASSFAVYLVVEIALSFVPLTLLASLGVTLFLAGPFEFGMVSLALALVGQGEARFALVFDGFDGLRRLGTACLAYLLTATLISIGFVFLLVPGVMAMVSYSMVFFVLAEHPESGPLEAMARSRALVEGHRWQILGFYLRFLGLYLLLGSLTLGLAFIWLIPYQMVSLAELYRELQRTEFDPGVSAVNGA
ncbi:MAG: hypothetical protein CL917_07160 [Deltaproteobacteria bacterium]|nr:hypothetical protein [Deltaproteobacteria bacterium]